MQQPECRVHSRGASYETAALSARNLMACKTSAGEGAIMRNDADDKIAIAVVEGVRGFRGV